MVDPIDALVQGIRIGRSAQKGNCKNGEHVDICVDYFPNVSFPCEVRFAIGDVEIAPPLAFRSNEEVMAMLGSGDLRVHGFALENGLLRGSIVNRTNAIHQPEVYVRLNGRVVRTVTLEPLRPLDDGGSICSFAVPIRIGDFCESGLDVQLMVIGIDHPVATMSFIKAPTDIGDRRTIELEEQVRQMQRATTLQFERLTIGMERQLKIQQERVDEFIEYAITLLVGVGADEDKARESAHMLSLLGTSMSRTQFRETPRSADKPTSTISILELDMTEFAFGWYDIETNEAGRFRWMGQTAIVRNPCPSRPIRKIEISIGQVYGSHEPMLSASLDETVLGATCRRINSAYHVAFEVPSGESGMLGSSIQIESFASGCPGVDHGTTDNRVLSVAVTSVKFVYAQP